MRNQQHLNDPYILAIAIPLIIIYCFFLFDKGNDPFIKNIYQHPFNDTIANMFTQKYKGGGKIAIALKHSDSAIFIDGINDSLNINFSNFSDEGLNFWKGRNVAILFKDKNSDSFYLLQKDRTIGFKILDDYR